MVSSRKSRPTLHDVAKAAGVGTTTVSRVINGGHYVAPKMLDRVQRVMADLGYQPNEAARSLKSERSRTIGLIIPSITDPFFCPVRRRGGELCAPRRLRTHSAHLAG